MIDGVGGDTGDKPQHRLHHLPTAAPHLTVILIFDFNSRAGRYISCDMITDKLRNISFIITDESPSIMNAICERELVSELRLCVLNAAPFENR